MTVVLWPPFLLSVDFINGLQSDYQILTAESVSQIDLPTAEFSSLKPNLLFIQSDLQDLLHQTRAKFKVNVIACNLDKTLKA